MGRCIKPIGGEFWFDDQILSDNSNNLNKQNAVLLNGGQSAIEFIINKINFNKNESILMPSYLCPSILYKFKQKNIKILFYEINSDLSINIESVQSIISRNNVKALFFIDYFGFYHSDKVIGYLKKVKEKGIILIEDAVQMLWFNRLNQFIGDYVFNSYRKFFPVDGSLVLCNEATCYTTIEDKYYNLIIEARTKKTDYIKKSIGTEEEFLNKFVEAEKYYYKRDNINGMDNVSRIFLNKVDYQKVKKLRLNNYVYLNSNLKELDSVKLLFKDKKIEDNVPLVLPILLKNRNLLRNELRKHSIYCPVHWNITNEIWSINFQRSVEISKSILSIPIDWRYNKKDMDYFMNIFSKLLIKFKE